MMKCITCPMIYTFILSWNEFIFVMTLILNDALRTIPVGIAMMKGETTYQWNMGLTAKGKNKEAAWTFISFLHLADNMERAGIEMKKTPSLYGMNPPAGASEPQKLALSYLSEYAMVIYYSFFQNMVVDDTPFSGLTNYIRFLTDSDLMKMVRFTVVFTVGSVFFPLVLGLFLVTKLNAEIYSIVLGILRAIFILLWIFTAAVVAIGWQLVLLPQGILNSVLSSLIGERILIDYLGRPFIAMSTLITIPQLNPVIMSVVLLDSIWTLNLFPLIWLLTGGGPLGSTDTIATFTYRYAFVDYQFGMASAAAVVGLIVTMIFTVFYVKRQDVD